MENVPLRTGDVRGDAASLQKDVGCAHPRSGAPLFTWSIAE